MEYKKNYTLRKPTGPHPVGCWRLAFETGERTLPCLLFYPCVGDGEPRPYAHEGVRPGAEGILTNSPLDATPEKGAHPLLLYNHGYSAICEDNTIQCEELASHGYFILCVGHPGEGRYQLPDGQVLSLDDKLMADFEADAAKFGKVFVPYTAWLKSEGKTASPEEHAARYQQILETQPNLVTPVERWADDSLAALRHFLDDPKWCRLVDREKIGAFGMSYGGAAALQLAIVSDDIKACADLDGFFYSPLWRTPIPKPALLMQSEGKSVAGLLTYPYLNAKKDSYLVAFRNSMHMNFTDCNETLSDSMGEGGFRLLGKIDPARTEDLLNTLLVSFFDRYLRGDSSAVINKKMLSNDGTLLAKCEL